MNVGSTSDLLPLAGGAFWLGGNTTAGWGAWWSDGTEGGTKLLTALDPLPSFPRPVFAALGSRTYFNAVDVAHGAEIWSTDGTANGTHLAADVRPGNVGSGATSFTPLGSSMLFVADDGTHGRELMIAKRRTP